MCAATENAAKYRCACKNGYTCSDNCDWDGTTAKTCTKNAAPTPTPMNVEGVCDEIKQQWDAISDEVSKCFDSVPEECEDGSAACPKIREHCSDKKIALLCRQTCGRCNGEGDEH